MSNFVGFLFFCFSQNLRKQAINGGFQVANKGIGGAGISFALDKILNACQETDSETIDVVVCFCGKAKIQGNITQLLRSLWSEHIRCALFHTNSSEDGEDIARDLCATYVILHTDDGLLRIRSWINDRFDERVLNRDEIVAYIKRGTRPEQTNDSNNVQQNNQYNDNMKYVKPITTMTKSTVPVVNINYSLLEKMSSSVRKRLENALNNQVAKTLVLFNNREQICIIVVDLQPNIVRAIIGAIDPPRNNAKEISNEIAALPDRFPDHRRHIKDIIEEIDDVHSDKERSTIICLYNMKDGFYRFIV